MLNDEICELREKLNKSIINGEDYKVTYKLSIELDELIAKYYKVKNVEKIEEVENVPNKNTHKKNNMMVIML